MKVRILKMIATSRGGFNPGDTADVPKKLGQAWCDNQLAMEDKSENGAKETKGKVSKEK